VKTQLLFSGDHKEIDKWRKGEEEVIILCFYEEYDKETHHSDYYSDGYYSYGRIDVQAGGNLLRV